MGLFDDNGSIAVRLARLIASPRVQHLGGQLGGAAQNYGARPLIGPPMSGGGGGSQRPSGAYANIGNQLGQLTRDIVQRAGASQQPQQQEDPLMALYQQLVGQLQQPVDMPTGVDTADLMRQVQNAINPIYDQRAQSAQNQSSRARKDVQGMYGALAKDYERLAPQQIAQADDAKQQIEDLYGQLRSNIEGSYSRVSTEQSELFKQLGIEAALPEVLDDQNDQVMEASIAASQNQAQQEQRYTDIGQMDSTFYREGSPNATLAGNEISTDMLAQLQDYLQQVESERSSGIQTAYMDRLDQAQNQLLQQQQFAQNEGGRRQEMLWDMLQSQLEGKQQQELNPDSFMSQLPPQVQQSVAGAFTRLQRSPEAVYGKVEDKRSPVPGTFVDTQPEWFMSQADEMLRRGEIDPVTHQALQMYMQLYYQMGQ